MRIGMIEAKIEEIKAEIKLYRRFGRSTFARRVLHMLVSRKLPMRKKQLARYNRRYARLKKEGKV